MRREEQDQGVTPSGSGHSGKPQAPSGLGHSASVPNAENTPLTRESPPEALRLKVYQTVDQSPSKGWV